jgi:hypothetical protein
LLSLVVLIYYILLNKTLERFSMNCFRTGRWPYLKNLSKSPNEFRFLVFCVWTFSWSAGNSFKKKLFGTQVKNEVKIFRKSLVFVCLVHFMCSFLAPFHFIFLACTTSCSSSTILFAPFVLTSFNLLFFNYLLVPSIKRHIHHLSSRWCFIKWSLKQICKGKWNI